MDRTLHLKTIMLFLLFVCLLAPLQPALAGTTPTVFIGTAASSNGSWSGASPDVWTPDGGGDSTVSASEIADRLANTEVVITAGSGSITVATAINWDGSNALTLNAGTNISINAAISAKNGTLKLYYGQGTTSGSGYGYSLGSGANVTLSAGTHFYTQQGSSGTLTPWTVITSLGSADSITGSDLQGINGALSGHYVLGADIVAADTSKWGVGFNPIGTGTTAFTGSFDGLGHTISNLYINRSTDYVGLFGYSKGSISNVGLVGGSITGQSEVGGLVGESEGGMVGNAYATCTVTGVSMVGGLVGWNYGNISNAYATGNVKGNNGSVGGLVGWNNSSISNAYATGNASSTPLDFLAPPSLGVGGLVGYNNGGSISNSYATGRADGSQSLGVGGLVGWNSGGSISSSYTTGGVSGSTYVGGLIGYSTGNISTSFFNTDTTSNACGYNGGTCNATGLNTAGMKTASSFSAWGSNISTTGGSSAVWRIYDTNSYPLLRSFLTPLSVTANDATKAYDGTAYSGGNGVQYAPAGYIATRVVGLLTYSGDSQKATDVGSYVITPGGLYSDQLGYDIVFISGTLDIINGQPAVVVYNGNANSSGTVPVDSTSHVTGTSVTVLGNSGLLTKSGYLFNGWNTASDGTGTTYQPGATFTVLADTVLYANWVRPLSVIYNGNTSSSGSVPLDSTLYVPDASVTVLGNSGLLTKSGYFFNGWNTAANGSGTTYQPGATFILPADTTLYANWVSSLTPPSGLIGWWRAESDAVDTVGGNNGSIHSSVNTSTTVNENETATLSCSSGTIISSYTSYGANGSFISCGSCPNGSSSCSILFNNTTCGSDPAPNTPKQGTLTITCSGASASLFSTGKAGQALNFSGNDFYIAQGKTYKWSVSNSFTMEFWAKPGATITASPLEEAQSGYAGTSGQRYAIFPEAQASSTEAGAGVSVGSNTIAVIEHAGGYMPALLVYNLVPGDILPDGWMHVAVVYDQKTPKLYVNGLLRRTGLTSLRTSIYPSSSFGEAGYGYGWYQGLLDEVHIFNRALDISEIQSIYNVGSAGLRLKPVFSAISPASGPATGGTTVTITGTNLTDATGVTFGATTATSFTVDSDSQITATAPAGLAGTVDVTVTTPSGTSATGSGDQFSYTKVDQTISFGTAPTIAVGGNGVVSATATSGLAVTFSSLTTDVCTISGATVTGVTAGTCTIAADQAGNGTYNPAGQQTQSFFIILPPSVTTAAATSITGSSATLNGSVNANDSGVSVSFEYGTTNAYGSSVTASPSQVSGNSVTPVTAAISTLSPLTTYHFRVKAVNAVSGTIYGDDATFTTTATTVTIGMAASSNGSWSGTSPDVWTPGTSGDSTVSASEITDRLASTGVTITAGSGSITVASAISWSSSTTLTLNAGTNIAINANISGSNGGLTLSAGSTISATNAVNVGAFTLSSGTWNQIASSLPSFNANDFRISGGTFIRALSGNGSSSSPYALTDIYGVQGIGSSGMLANYYTLTNNIDATGTANWDSGAGFKPIGNNSSNFGGSLNGLGHTISKLTINRGSTNYVGLFGYSKGSIINVGLTNASVTGYFFVGGLVGANGGSISNSYATGNVSGNSNVGGLLGQNYANGSISSSYASASVTGSNYVGGLVGSNNASSISSSYASASVTGSTYVGGLLGSNNGLVSSSYASASVTGSTYVGGLLGSNNGLVSSSYASASVTGSTYVGGLVGSNYASSISSSYFDTTTTGQNSACGFNSGTCGATGLTDAQMKTAGSFSAWGTDISSSGGSKAVWRIYEGNSYPLLRSLLTPLTVTANDVTKVYDGTAYSGGNGVQYAPADYNADRVAGGLTYSFTPQEPTAVGSYAITPGGLYSGQLGYDISFSNGMLYIINGPPTITTISPTSGFASGGTSVTITGTALTGATGVTFGATAATGFTVNSDSQITATSPAGLVGQIVDVTVTNHGITSATSAADQFSYTLQYQAKNQSTGVSYTTLAEAISAAAAGHEIRAYSGQFDGAVSLVRDIILNGGYNMAFSAKDSLPTTLNGSLSVDGGAARLDSVGVTGTLTIRNGSLQANGVTVQ